MFDAIAKTNIDPQTGKPYAFGNAGGQYLLDGQDRNAGISGVDMGSGVQNNLSSMAGQLDPAWLAKLGYTGPTTVQTGSGESYGTSIAPELQQFFQDKGLTLGVANHESDPTNFYLNAFDKNGQAVTDPLKASADDKEFGWAMAAAAAAATAGAAAYGGAGVGAGAGAGATGAAGGGAGLGADSLAYGALENGAAYGGGFGAPMVASSEAGSGLGALGGGGGATLGGASGDVLATGAGGAGTSLSTSVGGGVTEGLSGEALAGGAGGAGGGGSVFGSLGDAAGDAGSWLAKNPGTANLIGGGLNSLAGLYASSKATGAAKDAAAAADARLAPWYTAGAKALTGIDTLLADPSSITKDPAYKFNFDQGMKAATNGAASRGIAYSGAQDQALTRFGQGLASSRLNDSFDRLARVAGLGAPAAQTSASNSLDLGRTIGGADLFNSSLFSNGVNNSLGYLNYSQYKQPPRP